MGGAVQTKTTNVDKLSRREGLMEFKVKFKVYSAQKSARKSANTKFIRKQAAQISLFQLFVQHRSQRLPPVAKIPSGHNPEKKFLKNIQIKSRMLL